MSTKERPGDNNGSTGSTMLAIKAKSLRIALTDSVFIQRAFYHKRTDDPLVIRHIPLGNYQTVISSNTLIPSRKSLQVLTTKTPSEREREKKSRPTCHHRSLRRSLPWGKSHRCKYRVRGQILQIAIANGGMNNLRREDFRPGRCQT